MQKSSWFIIVLAAGVLLGVRSVPASEVSVRTQAKKLRVLVVTGGHGYPIKPFREIFAGYPDMDCTFIDEKVVAYFRRRLDQAPRDVSFALEYVKRHAKTAEQQQAVIGALIFKTEVLWAQLDALHHAYVTPGLIPPGAFRPEGIGDV